MHFESIRLSVEQIQPLFRAAGDDIELLAVDADRRHVLVKLVRAPERRLAPAVAELRTIREALRREHPSLKSVAIVQATHGVERPERS